MNAFCLIFLTFNCSHERNLKALAAAIARFFTCLRPEAIFAARTPTLYNNLVPKILSRPESRQEISIAMSTSPSVFDLIPVSQPPPGVESNFVNPEDEGYVMIAAGSVFIGLMLIFCMIRLYSKAFIVRRASWDDCEYPVAFSSYAIQLINLK